ncbi:signal peptidase I [Candidatus Roizmanbacteria bacterium RIFCSPLOWO2_01_FULL_37_16]|uniref:Signal peptidase I n=1 Tax=Candidatus Roizmanbacteria bacterium RIFCSPLOWO2_01_FULL_37_16 TaxID=1802058 RepID=A0A1F7IIU4_9BACT|nr:MAG: signal peptidase I [Candidatus Roizmanbacteria bacterium RIFCSPHIGHO2_01_FULL_37_16b]OGK34036.1 MAG: signal peptidase I [Candidatus Roizmanbacteria bacterium RIFCSPHIGHO2_12_FULL_36_11]OGK43286.1 MAG: signal peptidase I [Candidatus Roizmanbacteria bacterium RIFCSPLOWO2_01_FULL_37_16]
MGIIKALIDFVMDILETIVFIGSLFIVVYFFIMQPNQVKGASMEPTFYSGEYILTSKITYKFRSPHRGDVVIFKSPKNPDIDYIKRIVGLPGDKVVILEGKLYLNDELLTEPYISAATNLWESGFSKEGQPVNVPDNMVFVMGDNRPRSSDSREFGPVPIEAVIGEVFFRYFPASKLGFIKNPHPESLQTYLLPHFKSLHQVSNFLAGLF